MGIRPGISIGKEDFNSRFFARAIQVAATIILTIISVSATLVLAAYIKAQ